MEEAAEVVAGGYCRLQMPLKLALGVRETTAGHRLGALEWGGGGGGSPACNASLPSPFGGLVWSLSPEPRRGGGGGSGKGAPTASPTQTVFLAPPALALGPCLPLCVTWSHPRFRVQLVYSMPTDGPPALTHPENWSTQFHEFLAACLVVDPDCRPGALMILNHAFVQEV